MTTISERTYIVLNALQKLGQASTRDVATFICGNPEAKRVRNQVSCELSRMEGCGYVDGRLMPGKAQMKIWSISNRGIEMCDIFEEVTLRNMAAIKRVRASRLV